MSEFEIIGMQSNKKNKVGIGTYPQNLDGIGGVRAMHRSRLRGKFASDCLLGVITLGLL